MISLDNLKEGDYIAFQWMHGLNFDGDGDIIVTNITKVYEDEVLVHFLYGCKSESDFIKKSDILAIGNMKGNHEIKGWTGKFDILKPNHSLIIKDLKPSVA